MRTLWLLRHAKSSWADDSTSDHERPLNRRGRDAAQRLGRLLAGRGVRLDRVLCSSALRTRQTFDELAAQLPESPPCTVERDLYLASAGDLFSCVQSAPEAERQLMLIAHNPGVAELAAMLALRGDPALRSQLLRKYPTGGLAELRLDAPRWADLAQGCELASFAVPRDLPALD